MAPKQAGRHVSTQLEREAQGLKWKSASTIDRQRAQKKNRKQKKRQRKQMAETADWQNPPTPPTGPRAEASGRGQPDRSGQALPGDRGTSPIGLRSPTPQGSSDSGVEGGGLASGAEAPHPRRSLRPSPEQPAPETGVALAYEAQLCRGPGPGRLATGLLRVSCHTGGGAGRARRHPQASFTFSGGPDRRTHRGRTAGQCCCQVLSGKASDDPGSGHPAANGASGPQASKSR